MSVASSRSATKGWFTAPPMAEATMATRACAGRVGLSAQEGLKEVVHELHEGLAFGQEPDDRGVVEEGVDHPTARDGEVDHLAQQALEGARSRLRFGRIERRLEPAQFELDRRHDDRLLRLELVVHGCLRHPDGVRNHLQRRGAHSLLGEQVEGRRHDSHLCRAVDGGAQAGGDDLLRRAHPNDASRAVVTG